MSSVGEFMWRGSFPRMRGADSMHLEDRGQAMAVSGKQTRCKREGGMSSGAN